MSDTRKIGSARHRGRLRLRFTHGVVRVLPVDCRARHDAEFGSELYELVAGGASRWAQMAYATRLLGPALAATRRAARSRPARMRDASDRIANIGFVTCPRRLQSLTGRPVPDGACRVCLQHDLATWGSHHKRHFGAFSVWSG